MSNPRVLAVVMAGGEGTRLSPLTAVRSKPAVPFGARYRIVDFVLSNLFNSGVFSVYLLVQYRSQSLIEHVRRAWVQAPMRGDQFVSVVPPQMAHGPEWFQGTADAVYQNLGLLYEFRPDLVAVFGADHVYRMSLRQMVAFHLEREAEITVAALPVPVAEASAFGIIAADADGRIREFTEKPASPPPMPGDPTRAYASMGNYLFNCGTLVAELEEAHKRQESDFGRHVLPRARRNRRVFAYDFSTNRVPGIKAYEEASYWRDVGDIETYYAAHMDVLGLEPRLDLFNKQWPIYSSNYQGPVAKIVHGSIENSILAAGVVVNGARVRNSIIRREVLLQEDVEVDECVIMDYAVIERGAKLRRTIVDRHNTIAAGTRIGFDAEEDRQRFHLSDSGVVVVPKGARRPELIY
jgi:glucose-1-phosphate adenylyltransferase